MGYFLRFTRIIYSIYAFLTFILVMFLVFPLVCIASLFGERAGGNAIYALCRAWADSCMFLWGIRHTNIYEAPLDARHSVVFVFNHISYLDIPVLLKTFRKQDIRVLGKAEMAKIPIFGFIYRKAAILVQRDDAAKRAESVKKLKEILQHNISIVLAPEGTFNMTDKPLKDFYDGAFRIAIETRTAIRPVIFLDTYDRLNYRSVFSLNPGRSRSVFLEEIDISPYGMGDIAALKEKVYQVMETALIKYHAGWIKNTQIQ